MPVISVKVIKRAYRLRRCEMCRRDMFPGGSQVRLYGNADEADPKWVMFVCPACAKASQDPKLLASPSIHPAQATA